MSSISGGAYNWQKSKRRAGVAIDGKIPVTGFGHDGNMTLWLLSPIVKRQYKFKGGKPEFIIVGVQITDPTIIELRNRVVMSIRTRETRREDSVKVILSADVTLMEYAAAVILHDYDMSDDDLTMLLPGEPNSKWLREMCIHAIGGKDALDELGKMEPDALRDSIDLDNPGAKAKTDDPGA